MVADPDDYQRTKKLKAINETKSDVMELKRNRLSRIVELRNAFQSRGSDTYQRELASAVADYGNELLPLIEDAIDRGVIDESEVSEIDIENQFSEEDRVIVKFIINDGALDSDEPPHLTFTMAIYRQLERIQRKLGLGLSIEEEQTPAEI
jgi:hypothetical protein